MNNSMIQEKDVFVVAKGLLNKKLYVCSSMYNLYPSTTENILGAKMFDNYNSAANLAKKCGLGSSVHHYKLRFIESDDKQNINEENEPNDLESLVHKLETENAILKEVLKEEIRKK